jgi:peptide chain release factor 1
VPPTERSGRVHSSTVTVAVLDQTAKPNIYSQRSDEDFSIEWYSGSGAGGQHRNKHQNSCRMTHVPTGIVKSAQTRSRENSQQAAKMALCAELDKLAGTAAGEAVNGIRRAHVGSGERSDKRRTIRFQADQVVDHTTGKRMTADEYMKGGMDKLW